MRPVHSDIVPALLLISALAPTLGCGSTQPPPAPTPEPAAATQARAPAPAPVPIDPWVAMDEHGLPLYVHNRAGERITEVQPDFDLDQLDAYLANPESAPEISGRAVERLFDLAAVDLTAGQVDEAEATVKLIRARARNRNSAYAGTTMLAEIARRRAGDDVEAQKTAIAEVFRALPQSRFGSATVVFQVFQTQEQLAARAAQTKQQMLSLETASTVLFFTSILPGIVENRQAFLDAIAVVRTEHENGRAPRDFRFSTVDLTRERGANEVRIAVWDVGTNPALFEEQLFTNDNEEANGADDDDNGQADDIHGLAADGDAPNTALLFDPGEETIQEYGPFLRGIMDLRAGMASTEAAQRVLELMRSADSVEALEALEENLDRIGEWAHGTHVAGIMVAGNPHARLAIFRSAWAGEARVYHHRGPTDEELAAERANVEAIAAYINRHEIKVVNASLGFSTDYVEDQLRYEQDTYTTPAQVSARAATVQAHRRATWALVFESCPETLFVVAAGNSNRDVVEYETVSASIEADNVLAVGAVDRWGNWATFTNSNADRVEIFDHGVEVDSLIPNGERVPLSGTSMASPNVANLAGKMLVVNPNLTPTELRTVIRDTGDEIEAPFTGHIANERRAIARARQMARRRR
ncbi:MAG: S8 family serine peptidase [Deltaproteobacteria bacterium]|nr:S8 family serine peptidase [Deltaproteobacteria bacterium]